MNPEAFENLVEQGLTVNFKKFVSCNFSSFQKFMAGLPVYSDCFLLITGNKKKALLAEFYTRGALLSHDFTKDLIENALTVDLIFLDVSIDKIPLQGFMFSERIKILNSNSFLPCFDIIRIESNKKEILKERQISLAIQVMMCHFFRDLLNSNQTICSGIYNRANNQRLLNLLRFIHQNLVLNIEKMVELVFFSRGYLSIFFKKFFDMSLQHYLVEQRVLKSLREVVETKKSLSQIAEENGFTDQAYLNRRFKTTFKHNPLKVRKTYQEFYQAIAE